MENYWKNFKYKSLADTYLQLKKDLKNLDGWQYRTCINKNIGNEINELKKKFDDAGISYPFEHLQGTDGLTNKLAGNYMILYPDGRTEKLKINFGTNFPGTGGLASVCYNENQLEPFDLNGVSIYYPRDCVIDLNL